MAEYKVYNLKDPKTGQEEPQISSREEFDAIKQKVRTDQIKNPRTGQEGTAETIVKEEDTKQADAVNVAKDLARALKDALREHGDEMQSMFLKNLQTGGATIKVVYKPDEQGQPSEDEFVFRWDDGKVRIDNLAEPVELGPIANQSGRSFIQKDIAKDKILAFLQSHDTDPEPADAAAMPDGPVAEEQLWESEECQNAFCQAVNMYRKAKSKESIKALFRAARPYQKGNTIQEKLKGAVEWYNIYKENPPKNTKDQVFLEDDKELEEGYVPGVITALQKISEGLQILKEYINRTEDTHLGAYYREVHSKYESLLGFVKRQFEYDGLNEFMDLDDPIANGEPDNFGGYGRDNDEFNGVWDQYSSDDEPIVGEEDEFGPEVGDNVDYDGGHYKLYGWCGYEAVLQNVDDDRDFKIVKPTDIGIGQKANGQDLKETSWVDPDNLPDQKDELQRI